MSLPCGRVLPRLAAPRKRTALGEGQAQECHRAALGEVVQRRRSGLQNAVPAAEAAAIKPVAEAAAAIKPVAEAAAVKPAAQAAAIKPAAQAAAINPAAKAAAVKPAAEAAAAEGAEGSGYA